MNKKGAIYANIIVEDLTNSIEVTVFPRVYDRVAMHLAPDTIVTVDGVVEDGDGRGRMRAQNVTTPHVSAEGAVGPVLVTLPEVRCTPGVVDKLKGVLAQYPGAAEVHLQLRSPDRLTTYRLGAGYRVELGSPLFADLKALLGPSCVGMVNAE